MHKHKRDKFQDEV